jgi:hypothetical protein
VSFSVHPYSFLLITGVSAPTPLENRLFSLLSIHVPVIPIKSPLLAHASRSSSRARSRAPRANAFVPRPLAPNHLRTTLFRRPASLRKLRCEAAERFLWWREIEGAKQQPDMMQILLKDLSRQEESVERWDWEPRLSQDVAEAKENIHAEPKASSPCLPYSCPPLDPLHIPSLFLLSLSLLRPLRDSVLTSLGVGPGVRWLAIGAFCTGVGVGWLLSGP